MSSASTMRRSASSIAASMCPAARPMKPADNSASSRSKTCSSAFDECGLGFALGAGRVVSGFGTAVSRSCSREGSHAIVAGTRGCSEPRCRHLLVCSGISRTEFNPAGHCHLRNPQLVHRHAAVGRRHHGGTCGPQGPSQRRRLRPQLTAGTPGRRPALSATHDRSLRWPCAAEMTGASRDTVEYRDCHQGRDGSVRPPRDRRQESGPALLNSMRAIEGRLCGTESHNLCARSGSISASQLDEQSAVDRSLSSGPAPAAT